MRTILSLFLGAAGHDVVTAADADAALAAALRDGPAVIVGEHPLQLADGTTLHAALQADPRTAAIPFVVVTARALAEELGAAEPNHAAVFVKPPVFSDLVATVTRLAGCGRRVVATR